MTKKSARVGVGQKESRMAITVEPIAAAKSAWSNEGYCLSLATLSPGDHRCCLYETDQEHRKHLTEFMRVGIERGEKVLYIMDADTPKTVTRSLTDAGVFVQRCLDSGH